MAVARFFRVHVRDEGPCLVAIVTDKSSVAVHAVPGEEEMSMAAAAAAEWMTRESEWASERARGKEEVNIQQTNKQTKQTKQTNEEEVMSAPLG